MSGRKQKGKLSALDVVLASRYFGYITTEERAGYRRERCGLNWLSRWMLLDGLRMAVAMLSSSSFRIRD